MRKIALDLSVIQSPHRLRGIGSTAINFTNNIPQDQKKKCSFVLFLYEKGRDDALSLLNLTDINYEVRTLIPLQKTDLRLPGRLRRINGIVNSYSRLSKSRKGDPRIKNSDLTDVDFFLQFDQMQAPPRSPNTKTAVVVYDLIPYILESDYLWGYRTARRHGDSRKSSIRKMLLRKQYHDQLSIVCKATDQIIAISEHTKKDIQQYIGVDENKIKVIHLGVNKQQHNALPILEQYIENSWGYFPYPIDLSKKKFLLYVGGADPRRKIIDLVAAYNNLRAQGKNIALVFAGDSMKGPKNIPSIALQKYLINASYTDKMYYLGFVSDSQREWLYKHSLAMVYPSVYEGFGLPILEAMQYGTPVITYDNTSIKEVAGNGVLYADNALSIKNHVEFLLGKDGESERKTLGAKAKKQAGQYSWTKTAEQMLGLFVASNKQA